MARPLSRARYIRLSRLQTELRSLFAGVTDGRLSLEGASAKAYARTVYTNRVASRSAARVIMQRFKAEGLVIDDAGPRGGEGWKLSPTGEDLLTRDLQGPKPR
ncbi:hypothetical protein [Caulobacter sp. CCH5-E12]|jgi:hypothetical protein|uniref:hypothetical protein n=1 Tax=Caulobacter sp. CCH5-E12 TaxID=1768770 RepID=UPI000780610E|nr:hypothetical protein [Caulobacter sp. CCH5-E12]